MWSVFKSAVEGFIAHGALSRGAAIAFYVVTPLGPPSLPAAHNPCAVIHMSLRRAAASDVPPNVWQSRPSQPLLKACLMR